jgi:hypothetical protein
MRPLAVAGPLLGLALLHPMAAVPAALADPATAAPRAAAANPHVNCTCRANGRSYALGERVCLSSASGRRVAECRMQENVTSWILGPEGCAESASARRPAAPAGGPTRS